MDNKKLVIAGTRSGKTSRLFSPNLIDYKDKVVIFSLKSDLDNNSVRESESDE